MSEAVSIFIVFTLTLGPLHSIPAFFLLTQGADIAVCRFLALRSVLWATVITLILALLTRGLLSSWPIAPEALRITGGLLLLLSALETLRPVGRTSPEKPPDDEAALKRTALSPLAIPGIVTPWGVVAIVLFMGTAHGHIPQTLTVLTLLLLSMALNFVGLWFARSLLRGIGLPLLRVLGWTFAMLQASLSVATLLAGLRS